MRKKQKTVIGIILAIALLAILIPNLIIYFTGGIAAGPDCADKKYVAIVLGAKVYDDGRLSPMLKDRMYTSVVLYKQSQVKKLLLTGDHGQKGYDEVNAMLKYARKEGVPDKDIFTDHAGFSTYDSLYRAKEVFKVSEALIVTQEFHLKRAIYIGRSLGLQVHGVSADNQKYSSEWRSIFREIPASIKAFWQVLLKPKPKYLGEPILITGDGRKTRG